MPTFGIKPILYLYLIIKQLSLLPAHCRGIFARKSLCFLSGSKEMLHFYKTPPLLNKNNQTNPPSPPLAESQGGRAREEELCRAVRSEPTRLRSPIRRLPVAESEGGLVADHHAEDASSKGTKVAMMASGMRKGLQKRRSWRRGGWEKSQQEKGRLVTGRARRRGRV